MVRLEPTLIKRIDEFNVKELTTIAYWYGIREEGNPEFHALLMKKLS